MAQQPNTDTISIELAFTIFYHTLYIIHTSKYNLYIKCSTMTIGKFIGLLGAQ